MKAPKTTLLTTTLAALLSGAAWAAPAVYTVASTHTFPRFAYSHFGYSKQVSRFNKTIGTVTLDSAAKTGAVDISIDMTSVDTGFEVFNGHIYRIQLYIFHNLFCFYLF